MRQLPILCCLARAASVVFETTRTLAVRLRVPARRLRCLPNPFASRLPMVDELFPGKLFSANAFLTVAVPT